MDGNHVQRSQADKTVKRVGLKSCKGGCPEVTVRILAEHSSRRMHSTELTDM